MVKSKDEVVKKNEKHLTLLSPFIWKMVGGGISMERDGVNCRSVKNLKPSFLLRVPPGTVYIKEITSSPKYSDPVTSIVLLK
jgi:hypothetical protein